MGQSQRLVPGIIHVNFAGVIKNIRYEKHI
nr:MAG TPA: hypothetical protein [Bacteriophage sp.]